MGRELRCYTVSESEMSLLLQRGQNVVDEYDCEYDELPYIKPNEKCCFNKHGLDNNVTELVVGLDLIRCPGELWEEVFSYDEVIVEAERYVYRKMYKEACILYGVLTKMDATDFVIIDVN